jgi:hypothetical protein
MNINELKVNTLNRNNYDSWKVKMKIILKMQELWKYMRGKFVKPEAAPDNANAERTWVKDDDKTMLILIIYSSEISAI